jgi:hypothetical protein
VNILPQATGAFTRFTENLRNYTLKEKTKITAGAVAALVIVAWLAIIALALLSGEDKLRAAGDVHGTLFYSRENVRNFVLPRRTTD